MFIRGLLVVSLTLLGAASAEAITIYPVDRAAILTGARFDVKVEFDRIIPSADARVTIDGAEAATVLGQAGQFVAKEEGVEASAWLLRDAVLTQPGRHTMVASDGQSTATVSWEVYTTGPRQAAT
jgi:alkaline phosphatase